MQNNYFSYSLNKKNNIILISFSVIVLIVIIFLVGAILFAESWEDARLIGEGGGYSNIPILDRKGLDYFVEIKSQNVNDNGTATKQEVPQPVDSGKNIGG